ncbi:hypothetical protein H7200_03115 [Candidatus Saccharibacteria bacterium]|nr:hypothetical protein [Candidatus Saccharibacteria bacterium]
MAFFLGILTIIIALMSYGFYLRDMFKGKTKPHSVTWFIWGLLNSFIFFEQINNGAGEGAWVTGTAAVANILIFILSLKYGEKRITKLDVFCLVSAIAILVFWLQTADTVPAIILACVIFIVGFIPTITKAWRRSQEETTVTFALNGLKFFIALFALQSFTIVTALYPIVLMVLNGGFALFLVVRRIKH